MGKASYPCAGQHITFLISNQYPEEVYTVGLPRSDIFHTAHFGLLRNFLSATFRSASDKTIAVLRNINNGGAS